MCATVHVSFISGKNILRDSRHDWLKMECKLTGRKQASITGDSFQIEKHNNPNQAGSCSWPRGAERPAQCGNERACRAVRPQPFQPRAECEDVWRHCIEKPPAARPVH